MLRESVAVWRMLGFSDAEIRSTFREALHQESSVSKYPVRHESKVLDVANALGRWGTDTVYCDAKGAPAALRFSGPAPSFASLIEEVCPGFDPVRARDLLLEGAAIHIQDDGSILRTKNFLPVFGGAGAVYSHPVLHCLASVVSAQAGVMRREPTGRPLEGMYATCGALLPRAKWDHFHWQARMIASSVFLLGEWIDANRVLPEERKRYRRKDLAEPAVVLSIQFEADSKSNSITRRRPKASRRFRDRKRSQSGV